jgi:arsenate reductase
MTQVTLFGLKSCDTCRKAMRSLDDVAFVDVRAEGVPRPILDRALAQFGDRLVNTRSTTWRGLTEEDRAAPPLDLLTDHPTLMKRPLIVAGDAMYLGWAPEVRAALGAD